MGSRRLQACAPVLSITLGSLVTVVSVISGAVQQASPTLPDTPVGKRAGAYFATLCSGSEDDLRRFFTENLAPSPGGPTMAQRLSFQRMIRPDLCPIAVEAVREQRPLRLELVLRETNGRYTFIKFELEREEPLRLTGITFRPANASDAEVSPPEVSEAEAIAAIEQMLEEATEADEFAGTVLVARKGEIVLLKAYGLADRDLSVPNRPDTKFNLGSINKIFTRLAIGQLVEAGKLSLDQKLGTILPEYPNQEAREKITIRHLLDMSSGIGDIFGPRFNATPKDAFRSNSDYLPLFASEQLRFEPGADLLYSNGGYIVLGEVITRVSGEDYYDYMRRRVFGPAGMTDTDSYLEDEVVPGRAVGYTRQWDWNDHPGEPRRKNTYTLPARGSSAGGGYSTAGDLLRFTKSVLSDRLLSPEYTDWYLMGHEPGQGPKGERPRRTEGGLAMAGGNPGIGALLSCRLESPYIVIVLTNLDPDVVMQTGPMIRRNLAAVRQ